MSNPNIKPSNEAVVMAVLDPVSQAAATVTTAWVPMTDFEAIQAILQVGALGAGATVDAKLEQATSAAGAGAKDIAGKAITQLTKAGADDNKQVVINCRSDELDVAGGFAYVRLSVTVAVAACLISAVVLGHYARYQPHAAVATVDEVVG